MKRLVAVVLCCLLPALSYAATPVGPLNYQGRLLDDSGVPVTGGYDFRVNIYDDLNTGTLLYAEAHSNVQVNDGVYSFLVGTMTPITGTWDIDLWQGNINDLYLELEVSEHNAGSYETLSPRHLLTSSPHAFTSTLALSLGNKTAQEYDNILEGICVASKGKWLSIAEKCLGAGSEFPNTGIPELWSTLHDGADTDFTNLDLSGADISGINFYGVDMTGTQFIGTTYDASGFDAVTLDNTYWDGAVNNYAMPYPAYVTVSLEGATMTNMDLSGWDMYDTNDVDGFSAAELTGCPYPTPSGDSWYCEEMREGSSRYILFGSGANLSANSAASLKLFGVNFLNTDADVFSGKVIDNTDFKGIKLKHDFDFSILDNADFSYTTISKGNFDNATLIGAKFQHAEITGLDLDNATLTNANFDNAELENVKMRSASGAINGLSFIDARIIDTAFGELNAPNFSGAFLNSPSFQGDQVGNFNFTNASIVYGFLFSTHDNTNTTAVLDFTGANFFTDSTDSNSNQIEGRFVNADFSNATIEGPYQFPGNFSGANFTSTTFTTIFRLGGSTGAGDSNFQNATFSNCTVSSYYSTISVWADLTGATVSNCPVTADNVIWSGTSICPDGTLANVASCPGVFD